MYYSKLLLFGEYAILKGGMGLSIPYSKFGGDLAFMSIETQSNYFYNQSNTELFHLLEYLKENQMDELLHLDDFYLDLKNKLFFHSTIPQGSGLGSSGAVCAAVYSKYAKKKINATEYSEKEKLNELKNILAAIESFFHGESSGFDPLISYINSPLLIKGPDHFEQLSFQNFVILNDLSLFLINSGKNSDTQTLIKLFVERYHDDEYKNRVHQDFIPANDACIKAFLSGSTDEFFGSLNKLIHFQVNYLDDMIPENLSSHINTGLKTGAYYIKLCGSGGGGFLLGFTDNFHKAKHLLENKFVELNLLNFV